MIVTYHNCTLVTGSGIQHDPLVISTRTGRILPPEKASRHVIDARAWYLYPGLINAHDHLELNHYPRTRPRERYTNAREWAADMSALLPQEPFASLQKYPLKDRCWIGGLKNLFSGVTTVAHHNPLHRPLTDKNFPIHVMRDYGWSHSLYLTDSSEIRRSYQKTRRGVWMIHLAEGTDHAAASEIDQLRALGCLSDKTVLTHGVGLRDSIPDCGGLVWCPSTNFYLLGQTAQVQNWFGQLALGSDSRLTAEGDLLDELKCAYATEQLSAEQLFHTVTDHAAKVLKLPDRGDLQPGMQADILSLPASIDPDPYMALIKAKRADIAWVMRGGSLLWAQDQHTPNCQLDGVPYRLHPSVLKQVRRLALWENGLNLL